MVEVWSSEGCVNGMCPLLPPTHVSASTSAGMGNSTATTATLPVDNIPVDNTPGELKPYIYYFVFSSVGGCTLLPSNSFPLQN